jgi:hypothetical protein
MQSVRLGIPVLKKVAARSIFLRARTMPSPHFDFSRVSRVLQSISAFMFCSFLLPFVFCYSLPLQAVRRFMAGCL